MPILFADFVNGNNVRMVKAAGRLSFQPETCGHLGKCRAVWGQHLQGNFPVE